tara:strand:- start:569 stop:781 length:213 start_codon:yes stop_codon:yes gene_type:complete
MKSPYGSKKGPAKRAEKLLKKKNLTKRQEDTMKRHSVHHTKKHMDTMRSMMLKGKTFGQAHKAAMKKVGK